MNYIVNAFSFNMMDADFALVRAEKVCVQDIPKDVVSAIGHADTARVVSGILGFEVACNRMQVSLEPGDVLYLAQYKGPRLPEGATSLPEGATLEFLMVQLDKGCPKDCRGGSCNMCRMVDFCHP